LVVAILTTVAAMQTISTISLATPAEAHGHGHGHGGGGGRGGDSGHHGGREH
jgi:hypothetical protein